MKSSNIRNLLISYDPNFYDNSSELIAKRINANKCIFTTNYFHPRISYIKDNIVFEKIGLGFPYYKDYSSKAFLSRSKFSDYEEFAKLIIQRNQFTLLTDDSDRSINETYLKIMAFVENLFLNEINLVILTSTPHQSYDYFFYIFAKQNNIEVIFINIFYQLKYNTIFQYLTRDDSVFDFEHSGIYANFLNTINLDNLDLSKINPGIFRYLHLIGLTTNIDSSDEELVPIMLNYNFRTISFFLPKIRFYFKLLITLKVKTNFFVMKLFYGVKSRMIKISNSLTYYKLIRYYDLLSFDQIDLTTKYIFFPLHFQPEATTLPAGGIYVNQILAIKKLRMKLSNEVFIYVKDHPAYLNKSNKDAYSTSRSRDYYDEIIKMEKVKIIPFNTPSNKLIEHSIATATITGSVIIESIKYGKYCVVFGNTILNNLSNVIKFKTIKDSHQLSVILTSADINLFRKSFIALILTIDKISKKIVDLDAMPETVDEVYNNYSNMAEVTSSNILDYLEIKLLPIKKEV